MSKQEITACKSSFFASHFLLLLLGAGKSQDRQSWWMESSSLNSASPSSWNTFYKTSEHAILFVYSLRLWRKRWRLPLVFTLSPFPPFLGCQGRGSLLSLQEQFLANPQREREQWLGWVPGSWGHCARRNGQSSGRPWRTCYSPAALRIPRGWGDRTHPRIF